MSSLIIVESPAKVKTIKKFLGDDFKVTASVGHVVDLPKNKLAVDEEHDYKPEYVIMDEKKHVVKELKDLASKADVVYLASDPDREGEAIAFHVKELIEGKAKDIKRITFNEITKSAVLNAINNSRSIDMNLYDAQQARRVLDRLVGYKLSPLLWKSIMFGVSAGRVQSVALRLIVDKELLREAFIPVEYWNLNANLLTEKKQPITVSLYKVNGNKANVPNEEEAIFIENSVTNSKWVVESTVSKDRSKHPSPPFTTSTLQQVASQKLGYSSKHTMAIAQKLYEGITIGPYGAKALITYMRTDSVRLSDEIRASIKDFVINQFGDNYYHENFYKSKSSAQDAHEGIRPVDVTMTPDMVKPYITSEQYHLYRLIWARAIASQMSDAQYKDLIVTVKCEQTLWRAKGSILTFPGYLQIWPYRDEDVILPEIKEGETLTLEKVTKEQKFTQPPARYSEASLVKELEELGIGRPSTYASIISTLTSRRYVEKVDGKLVPTELGRTVVRQLLPLFQKLMDVHFTADMENNLDKIAAGEINWVHLIREYMKDFDPQLKLAHGKISEMRENTVDLRCPQCNKPMTIVHGKKGSFLACTGYPNCKFTSNFTRDENGKLHLKEKDNTPPEVVGKCPTCGGDLVKKKSYKGTEFVACSNYPKCKYVEATSTGVTCPECHKGVLQERRSKKKRIFYGCSDYPNCKFVIWQKPVNKECPKCHSSYLVEVKSKDGITYKCPNKDCDYSESE